MTSDTSKRRLARAKARGWFRGQRYRPGQTLILAPLEETPAWAEEIEMPADFDRPAQGDKVGPLRFVDLMARWGSQPAAPRNQTSVEQITLAEAVPLQTVKRKAGGNPTTAEEMLR